MGTLELRHGLELGLKCGSQDLHRVQFYKSDRFLIGSAAEHLGAALCRGGAAVTLATKAHRQAILKELRKLGVPEGAVVKRCIVADAAGTLAKIMLNDRPDPDRFRTAVGALFERALELDSIVSGPIAMFGEMVALLCKRGKHLAALELEQFWNEFLREHPGSLLCAYPLANFARDEDRALFAQICTEHSSVVPAEDVSALVSEDEKTREIAVLQQRAEALEREVAARKAAEERLRVAYAELESVIEQRTKALRQLSLHVLKVQDLERRRIARELHDSVGQDIAGLKVNLGLARKYPENARLWADCDQVLENCINGVRALSYLLHPPIIEEAGFVPAAQWYVNDFSRRSGIEISLQADGDAEVPESAKLVLFRVLQESLMNLYRHGHASSAHVAMRRERGTAILEVQDNGTGIPREKLAAFNRNGTGMGVGLTGMRERVRELGGDCQLFSGPNGTLVRVSIPLDEASSNPAHSQSQASGV